MWKHGWKSLSKSHTQAFQIFIKFQLLLIIISKTENCVKKCTKCRLKSSSSGLWRPVVLRLKRMFRRPLLPPSSVSWKTSDLASKYRLCYALITTFLCDITKACISQVTAFWTTTPCRNMAGYQAKTRKKAHPKILSRTHIWPSS